MLKYEAGIDIDIRVSHAPAKRVVVPPPELPETIIFFLSTGNSANAQSISLEISHTLSPIGVRPTSKSCINNVRQEYGISFALSSGVRVFPKPLEVGAIAIKPFCTACTATFRSPTSPSIRSCSERYIPA